MSAVHESRRHWQTCIFVNGVTRLMNGNREWREFVGGVPYGQWVIYHLFTQPQAQARFVIAQFKTIQA